MLYSVLIYDSEAVINAIPKDEMDRLIGNHEAVQKKLAAEGKLGPVVRLMPTTTATTIRQGEDSVVVDGPFAETKEQLLGLYIIDCPTLEEAIEAGHLIGTACNSRTLEIRPIQLYFPAPAPAPAQAPAKP